MIEVTVDTAALSTAGIGFAAGFGIFGTWKLPANAENRVSFRGSRQRLVRLIP